MKNVVLKGLIEFIIFYDNYDHPIVECGKRLIDMIYLKKYKLLKKLIIMIFF